MKKKFIPLFVTVLFLTGCNLQTPDLNKKIIAAQGVPNTESIAQIQSNNISSSSMAVSAYDLMQKLGIVQSSSKENITTDDVLNALDDAGYTYTDFTLEKLDKNCICLKDSVIAVCMAKSNDVYTVYIYDDNGSELKTLTGADIEKYKFDKIFMK